jgi:hypothetical protein
VPYEAEFQSLAYQYFQPTTPKKLKKNYTGGKLLIGMQTASFQTMLSTIQLRSMATYLPLCNIQNKYLPDLALKTLEFYHIQAITKTHWQPLHHPLQELAVLKKEVTQISAGL